MVPELPPRRFAPAPPSEGGDSRVGFASAWLTINPPLLLKEGQPRTKCVGGVVNKAARQRILFLQTRITLADRMLSIFRTWSITSGRTGLSTSKRASAFPPWR